MMIDGVPNRPLYFYQKDIIDSWIRAVLQGAPLIRGDWERGLLPGNQPCQWKIQKICILIAVGSLEHVFFPYIGNNHHPN